MKNTIKGYYSKGQWYSYHRRSRKRIRAPWGTPAFDAELAEIQLKQSKTHPTPPAADSLRSALQSFQDSDHFRGFNLRTRTAYCAVIKWLPPKDSAILLPNITAAFGRRLRDKAAKNRGLRFGNWTLHLLQSVIAFSVGTGTLAINRVAHVPKLVLMVTQTTRRRPLSSERLRRNDLTDSNSNRIFDHERHGAKT